MSTNRFRWQTMFRGRGGRELVCDRAFKSRRKAANYIHRMMNLYPFLVEGHLADTRDTTAHIIRVRYQ